MSIRAVLSCNGKEGIYDCRQATPVGEVLTAAEARRIAKKIHGWSSQVMPGPEAPFLVHDFCQACTKRRQESN
jgi:hypothetical protein